MFLHGSRHDIQVGDILLPGVELDLSDNGGKSNYVYLVMTDGFSLSECEEGANYKNTFDFSVSEALWWGGERFIYSVEPLGKIEYDDNHDVSPACVKTSSAKIVAKYNSNDFSFDDLCRILKNSE